MTVIPELVTRRYVGDCPSERAAERRRVLEVAAVLRRYLGRERFAFEAQALRSDGKIADQSLDASVVRAAFGGPPPLIWAVITFAAGALSDADLQILERDAALRLFEEHRFPPSSAS